MTTDESNDVRAELKRAIKLLTIAVSVCLVFAISVGSFAVWLAFKVNDTTETQNAALCTFRADVQTRAQQGEDFLRDHPEGFAGIPAATLRQSIDGQRRTVAALARLDCPLEKLP